MSSMTDFFFFDNRKKTADLGDLKYKENILGTLTLDLVVIILQLIDQWVRVGVGQRIKVKDNGKLKVTPMD